MKYLVVIAFAAILGSLGAGLFFMMRGDKNGSEQDRRQDNQKKSSNMVRALAFRVGYSILLFACILLAWKLGYVRPTGISAGQ